ncbi:MAG: helix-turn-helix domain-containing protein [Actinomycetota bacterium]|nr:helix-turn-helix domain-containing protein [Actinomycetota bacterium]
MPPAVADVIEPELPALAGAIIAGIGNEVPEYARPLEGSFGRGVRRGVEEALGQFLRLIRDPDADREDSRTVYIELGRGELRQGRTLDALQSAYRIGARIAWRHLATAALAADLDRETMSVLAESIFAYIDGLSADSVEGYAAAQSEQEGERLRRDRRLVRSLLSEQPASPEELRSLSGAAGWRLPKTAAALCCHESDLAEITRRLPFDVISAMVETHACVLIPDSSGPGRPGQIDRAIGDLTAALGPETPLSSLPDSWRIARLALRAAEAGAIRSATGPVHSDEHLVELVIFNSRGLINRIGERTLGPIRELTPKGRDRMSETALAFLEERGNAAAMAEVLGIHPQTARYRVARLRELLGDSLDRPEDRLALELSLRARRPAEDN